MFITRTEVVQPVFTRRCFDETVLRTPAIADKLHFAAPAVFGERVALIGAEFALEC